MRKVLCSLAAGPHRPFLELSGPTFVKFAERHGYELSLHTEVPVAAERRPAPWAKIEIITALLRSFELVLWLDADAIVIDDSHDIADQLDGKSLMGMVAHPSVEGDVPVPNTGVWILRRHRRTRRFLREVWSATEFVDHKWWENAAVIHRLGYDVGPPVREGSPSRMREAVTWLGAEWNSIPSAPASEARIEHFPGLPLADRLVRMREVVAGHEDQEPS